MWPVKERMKAFGEKEVGFIVKHCEESLVSAGMDVDSVQLEWTLSKKDLYSDNDPEEIKICHDMKLIGSGDTHMKTSWLSLTSSFAFLPPAPSAREASVPWKTSRQMSETASKKILFVILWTEQELPTSRID